MPILLAEIVRQAIERGHSVTALVRSPERLNSFRDRITIQQGDLLNTGLHDIWNLVWKLDLVLRGHGNEKLLKSYSAERRPVIKQVIETTDFLIKAMGTPNKFAQALRDMVIPMVSRLATFQYAFVQRLSITGVPNVDHIPHCHYRGRRR